MATQNSIRRFNSCFLNIYTTLKILHVQHFTKYTFALSNLQRLSDCLCSNDVVRFWIFFICSSYMADPLPIRDNSLLIFDILLLAYNNCEV